MNDQLEQNQQPKSKIFLSKYAVIFVRIFGSWASIAVHTLIFAGWFIFKWNLEQLLVIVSIEAIYIGIFILMAENIETAQRDQHQKQEHQRDMAMVKQDVVVDKKSLKEIQEINLKVMEIHELIKGN